ncbi:MAG: NUDIX hydrolase [Blastocatellia bacterium]|nr:NUDIX hydrolase [Blastocatellia bacterium]
MENNMRSDDTYLGDASKGELQIIREVPVYENQYGALYDDEVLFPSGASGRYIRYEWAAPYSIGILPVMKDGRLVLIRSFRHALRNWFIEIPKGFGSSEATPEDSAREELIQETGLSCANLRRMREVVNDPGFIANRMIIFIAEDCECSQLPKPEPYEAIESSKAYSIDEIRRMIENGDIQDSVTLLVLLDYLNNR